MQLLTHSRQQSFKTCRRRHWWEYEIGIRRETDAKALRMGSAGHSGLHLLNLGVDVVEAITRAARKHYAGCPETIELYDWEIERETIVGLLVGYEWRWRDQPLKVIASEQSFQIPLRNPKTKAASSIWNLAGKIDGIIELEDGRLAVLENKFISDPLDRDGDYWRRLQLDSQISTYVHAARELGHDVQTVLYNVIRKPTIKPEQIPLLDADGLKIVIDANDERVLTKQEKPRQTSDLARKYILQSRQMTPSEWRQKLSNDIESRPDFYFARVEIPRLDSDIKEMLRELWEIQKTIRDAQNTNRWYKTVSRDSCSWCPFFGLCSSRFDPLNGEVPEGFTKLDYVHPELKTETEVAQ